MLHLVKMEALSCVPTMRVPYERLLTGRVAVHGTERRVPLHLFPGEQLAAQLEVESMELLNEEVKIPPELVSLLERDRDLERFARALAFDVLISSRDRDTGKLVWAYLPPHEHGEPGKVHFGTTALEACRNFCNPTGDLRQAREAVLRELAEKHKTLSDQEYGELLRSKARGRIVPDGDNTEPALRDGFDRCLRMLLQRHTNNY